MKRAIKTIPVAVRLDPKRHAKLERLAAAWDRPKSWVVEKALDSYLDDELQRAEKIRQGLADLDAGRWIPHEEVMAQMRRKIENARRKRRKRTAAA